MPLTLSMLKYETKESHVIASMPFGEVRSWMLLYMMEFLEEIDQDKIKLTDVSQGNVIFTSEQEKDFVLDRINSPRFYTMFAISHKQAGSWLKTPYYFLLEKQ